MQGFHIPLLQLWKIWFQSSIGVQVGLLNHPLKSVGTPFNWINIAPNLKEQVVRLHFASIKLYKPIQLCEVLLNMIPTSVYFLTYLFQ
jgi:hypothetical protein